MMKLHPTQIRSRWQTAWFGTRVAIVFALVCVWFAPTTTFAQTSTGISGTVVDASGAYVPDAEVTIVNPVTGVKAELKSNSSGTYRADSLIPGTYEITIKRAGFGTVRVPGVKVDVGGVTPVTTTLAVGTDTTTVTVEASAITLTTDTPTDSTVIETKEVMEIPIEVGNGAVGNVPRQIDSFIFLAAGTTGTTFAHNVNGGISFSTETIYNGVPQPQSGSYSYETATNPPFESVGEFRLLRTGFSAQYGLGQGAVSYNFRSGTNKYHGAVWELLRNNVLDAAPFGFGTITKPAIDRQNDFGGRIGGPIRIPHLFDGRDKLFFYFTRGGYEYRGNGNNNPVTVPTKAEKGGDFSSYPEIIFDPTTNQPFPGNIIPTNRISALSNVIEKYIPDPDLNQETNNMFPKVKSFPQDVYNYTINVDYNMTPTQSFHVVNFESDNGVIQLGGGTFPVPASNPLSGVENSYNYGNSYVGTYNNTLSSNKVLQLGYSYYRQNDGFAQGPQRSSDMNFPGLNFTVMPEINFSGFGLMNNVGFGNTLNMDDNMGMNWVANLSWIQGRHTFNIGTEYRWTTLDNVDQASQGGTIGFANGETSDPSHLGSNGSAFASFLLGLVNTYSQANVIESKFRDKYLGAYVQDDIKLSPKLTINAGIRYDLLVPFHDTGNNDVFLNPNASNPYAGGLPGVMTKFGDCNGCIDGVNRADIHGLNLAPRAGFSYAINDKTLLRGSASMSYLPEGAWEFANAKIDGWTGALGGSIGIPGPPNNQSIYGNWDSRSFPEAQLTPFSPSLQLGQSVNYMNLKKDGRAPYVSEFVLQVQRELPQKMLLTVGYTGNQGRHLASQLNPLEQPDPSLLQYGPINVNPDPTKFTSLLDIPITDPRAVAQGMTAPYAAFATQLGGSASVGQSLRPFPMYTGISTPYDMEGKESYNALMVELQKRYDNGLSILTNYVWSKTMTNASSGFNIWNGGTTNKYYQQQMYVVSPSDVPQNFKLSGVYELPIGHGKRFLNKNRALDTVVGGWQIAANTVYYLGAPVGLSQSNEGGVGSLGFGLNPIRVAGVNSRTGISVSDSFYKHEPYLNRAAFQDPPTHVYALNNYRGSYGDIRQPGYAKEDANIGKTWSIAEYAKVTFKAEAFNLINRVLPGNFTGNIDNTDPNSGFGLIGSSVTSVARQGQLDLRIDF